MTLTKLGPSFSEETKILGLLLEKRKKSRLDKKKKSRREKKKKFNADGIFSLSMRNASEEPPKGLCLAWLARKSWKNGQYSLTWVNHDGLIEAAEAREAIQFGDCPESWFPTCYLCDFSWNTPQKIEVQGDPTISSIKSQGDTKFDLWTGKGIIEIKVVTFVPTAPKIASWVTREGIWDELREKSWKALQSTFRLL